MTLQRHAEATNTTVGRWGYRAWDERCQPDDVVAYLAGGDGDALRKSVGRGGDGKLRMLLLGHRRAILRLLIDVAFCVVMTASRSCLRHDVQWVA